MIGYLDMGLIFRFFLHIFNLFGDVFKVLDKPNKNCSAGSGDGSTGANFCIKAFQEFKLLNWDELLRFKGKWIDIIHNINFNSDPDKGYFKIWK